MANTYVKYQGDSLWIDVPVSSYETIDNVWEQWAGTWEIRDLTEAVKLSGSLIRSVTPGMFYLRIGPVSGGVAWNTLDHGTYALSTTVFNTVKDFAVTEEDKLVIATRGF